MVHSTTTFSIEVKTWRSIFQGYIACLKKLFLFAICLKNISLVFLRLRFRDFNKLFSDNFKSFLARSKNINSNIAMLPYQKNRIVYCAYSINIHSHVTCNCMGGKYSREALELMNIYYLGEFTSVMVETT